jgi:hypothetical protein
MFHGGSVPFTKERRVDFGLHNIAGLTKFIRSALVIFASTAGNTASKLFSQMTKMAKRLARIG